MAGPYSYFGFNIARYRYKRRFKAAQFADYLGIKTHEYMQLEAGNILPSPKQILELSRVLKIDPSRIKRWLSMAVKQREVSDTAFKGAPRFSKDLDKAIKRVEHRYKEITADKLNPKQNKLLTHLRRDVTKLRDFPVLPINHVLIVDALNSMEAQGKKHLHEITDFLLEEENMASCVSRHCYLAPFIFYVANQTYARNRPFKGIEECFNQLTLSQFREMFWIATNRHGIYDVAREVPLLQKLEDFQSLGALMARELQPLLPESVNYHHLFAAILLKDIGAYALYTLLKPTIRIQQTNSDLFDEDRYPGLNATLMDVLVYELHPIISGMIAANWNLPEEVLDAILMHHHDLVHEVSPLCAMLKIINSYVDNDFPEMSKEAIVDFLKGYPQISLKPEDLFTVANKLKKARDELYTRSSHALDQTSQKVRGFSKPAGRSQSPHMSLFYQSAGIVTKRPDLRLDLGYQGVVLDVAIPRHQHFCQTMLMPGKRENLKNFEYRLGNQFLRLCFALTNDLQAVSEEHGVSPDEITTRILS